MKVLYLGSTWRGSNGQSFRRAFERLGHEVVAVDTEAAIARAYRSVAMRAVRRLAGGTLPHHRRAVREASISAVRDGRPNLVFAAKALYLDAATLEEMHRVSGAYLLHWHPDDYKNPANATPEFLGAIPGYDVCVTPKSFNVAELQVDGARRVEFVPYAFDPEIHAPAAPRPGAPTDACFVGGWEPERASYLEHAARQGVDLEIWGDYWNRLPRDAALRRFCRFRPVFAEDMARVFASSKLSLGFLRKVNRDLHTARTFEIPASGGVMLAERTDEQRMYFEEGKEALYFDSADEMVATIREYAGRPKDLARIRAAALERCERGAYSYEGRLAALLETLGLS